MRRLLILALLVSALLPCGLSWDGCDEESSAGCSTVCHLGCALAAVPSQPAPVMRLEISRDLRIVALDHPSSRPHLPETPPPRA